MQTNPLHSLETWTAPECPLTIEYPPQVMEELRLYALEGLRHLSRGGIEVGGVLFGIRGEQGIRILSWLPILCEHSKGPGFVLSDDDFSGLAKLLEEAKSDAELADQQALGWFVTHTRAGIALTDSDLEVYEQFFPWTWQVTLVMQPARDGAAQAGFFVRDAHGNVKADASYRAFELAPSGGKTGRNGQLPLIAKSSTVAASTANEASVPPQATKLGRAGDRRLWIWAAPILLAAVFGALLLQHSSAPRVSPSVGFHATDERGELRLEWDKQAGPIRDAKNGKLEIRDGGAQAKPVEIALDSQHLKTGSVTYARKSGDLEARLTVYPNDGDTIQETTRFVGAPVVHPEEEEARARETQMQSEDSRLRQDRDNLAGQVRSLKEELRKVNARNRELENAVRVLENRVQVEQLHKPVK